MRDSQSHPLHLNNPYKGQGGLKGTLCPAHYMVLADEAGFGLECLQQLSYVLCHMQQRVTRIISLLAPLYCTCIYFLLSGL